MITKFLQHAKQRFGLLPLPSTPIKLEKRSKMTNKAKQFHLKPAKEYSAKEPLHRMAIGSLPFRYRPQKRKPRQ